MNINITEEEAKILIDALAIMSRDYSNQVEKVENYNNQVRKYKIDRADQAYKLCMDISKQLEKQKEKKINLENQPKKIDPFDDPDWTPNDPRGW